MSEEEKGFIIKDKRGFTAEGEPRKTEETEPDSRPETEPGPQAEKAGHSGQDQYRQARQSYEKESRAGERASQMPPLNFAAFIYSLASSALIHLGQVPDPVTQKTAKNLQLAKQTIDILGLLKEKTKGNLDDDEEQLFKNLLYELRMKYVSQGK